MSEDFDTVVARMLGEQIRTDSAAAIDMWSALANVGWESRDGRTVGYSFRAAAGLIADIRGDGGSYLDWYCSGRAGIVADYILAALAAEGWLPVTYDLQQPPRQGAAH